MSDIEVCEHAIAEGAIRGLAPVSEVQTLFNSKARSWEKKYGPGGGKLYSRLELFTVQLSGLCPPPARIFDLGCGTGEMAAATGQMGYEVSACDIAENMLKVARDNWAGVPVEWLCLKPGWTVLPFKDSTFEAIVSSSVFEYLVDVEGVVGELARVLRPEGILIFSIPNPYNRIRKMEGWFRSGFFTHFLPRLVCGVQPVKSYLTYLRLSRNRFSATQWESILRTAGLEAVDRRDLSEVGWREHANSPLIVVAVKKTAPSRLQPVRSVGS